MYPGNSTCSRIKIDNDSHCTITRSRACVQDRVCWQTVRCIIENNALSCTSSYQVSFPRTAMSRSERIPCWIIELYDGRNCQVLQCTRYSIDTIIIVLSTDLHNN